jgi:hypothetical protein
MIARILQGGPWSDDDRAEILHYCGSDVLLLERLLLAMLPRIDLPRALLRGRFMKAAAAIEWNGTPIDTETLELLRRHWTAIQDELIAEIDHSYGVFDGRSFRQERWREWLNANGIPWPTTDTGQLKLTDRTFREMAKADIGCLPVGEDVRVGRCLRHRAVAENLAGRLEVDLRFEQQRGGGVPKIMKTTDPHPTPRPPPTTTRASASDTSVTAFVKLISKRLLGGLPSLK